MALKHTNPTKLSEHQNPSPDRAAKAPYNFVPLPDVVLKAVESADALPDHDCYANGRHTGCFEVTLTTKTPLYIRGGLSAKQRKEEVQSEYAQAEAEKSGNAPKDFRKAMKNKPEFFTTHNPEQPLIPGSSLRGMLRSLVEIITYSKMKWVTDKPIIYRAVGDPTAVGNSYRKKVMGNNKTTEPDMHYDYPIHQLKGGYLRQTVSGWAIQPAQKFMGESFVRVNYTDIESSIGGHGRQRVHDVYVRPASRKALSRGRRGPGNLTLDVAVTSNASTTPGSSLKPAKLVESGHMGGRHAKHWHCAIYEPDTTAKLIPIPEELWQIYQEDRDMTRGFKTRKLAHDKDPLFYLLNAKNELVFFGPTMMFRLPYHEQALDLVPPTLRDPNDIDYAEAIFGFVRTQEELKQMKVKPKQGSKGRSYAGRVFVSDGHYEPDQSSPWLLDTEDGIVEPHILASPKPTSFQLYLTQDTPNNRKALYHYDSNVDTGEQVTTLRGFKLYWSQGIKTADDLKAKPKDERDRKRAFETGPNGELRPKWNSTQHTRMKPVNSGKKFTFKIHFENLTDVELGSLQWALSMPNCHRLGMGKPLGMGVVQLKPTLHLNGRSDRYKTLLADNGKTWHLGKSEKKQDFTTDFEKQFLHELRKHNVSIPGNFRDIERIKMLLTILTWHEQAPQADRKQYTTDLNQFRPRPVLPDPFGVIGEGVTAVSPTAKLSSQKAGSKKQPPKSEQKKTSPKTQPKKPNIGERVLGTVYVIEPNGDVYLKPEKENYQSWLFRIAHDRTESIHYQLKQKRACLVITLLPNDEIVECKPAPPKKRRKR